MIPTQYARIFAASAVCLALCAVGTCADEPNHVNIDGIFDPIAFTANNQSTLPNYKLTRNKLANPSFEQGLNGWSSLSFSPIPRQQWDRDFLFIDQSTRVHGSQSLRVLAWNGPGVMLKALMSQTQPGQTYTLSFYAKSEVNGPSDYDADSKRHLGKVASQPRGLADPRLAALLTQLYCTQPGCHAADWANVVWEPPFRPGGRKRARDVLFLAGWLDDGTSRKPGPVRVEGSRDRDVVAEGVREGAEKGPGLHGQ